MRAKARASESHIRAADSAFFLHEMDREQAKICVGRMHKGHEYGEVSIIQSLPCLCI